MLVISCPFKPLSKDIGSILQESMKANRYRNGLMNLYLQKVNVFRELRLAHFPECATMLGMAQFQEQLLKDRLLELSEVLRKDRDGHPLTAEVKKIRKELFSLKKDLSAFLKPKEKAALDPAQAEFKRRYDESGVTAPRLKEKIRKEILAAMFQEEQWSPFWKQTRQLEEQYISRCQLLRKNCGLSVGTYLGVETAHESALKKSKGDPSFKSYRGDGRLGHQCVRGKVSPNMLQIIPRTDEQSVRKKWATVRFNIGKVSDPVWVEGKICLRRYSPDATVKWVYLIVRRVGLQYDFDIQFTVTSEREYHYGSGGTAAVNISWRRLPSGDVRVGFVVDDAGQTEELRMSGEIIERERYFQSIEGFCKKNFTLFHTYLSRTLKEPFEGKPPWMDEQIENIHAWKAHGRLARIAMAWESEHLAKVKELWASWKQERLGASPKKDLLDSPEVVYHWAQKRGFEHPLLFVLLVWRKKDEHLVNGFSRGRARLQRRRLDFYRGIAKRLSEKYSKVVIGPKGLDGIVKSPLREEDRRTKHDENANRIRLIVAPSVFKQCLLKYDNVSGEDSKYITQEHFGCGGLTLSDMKKDILCKCSACGQVYDQDHNAAKHLLHRARARTTDGLHPGGSSSCNAAE